MAITESQQLIRALALLEAQNIQIKEMRTKIDNLEIQNRQLKGMRRKELDEIRRKADSGEKVGRRNLFPDATFNLFSELPPEIQDCIWDFALPGPKVVSVVPRMRQFWQSLQRVDRGFNRYFTPAKHSQMPPLLRTCRASRQRALRASGFCFFPSATWNLTDLIPKPPLLFSAKHDEVFTSKQSNLNNVDYVAPGVRFQPALDTIYLSGCARLLQPLASDHQGHLDTRRIQSLAISAESDYNDARLFLHNMGRKDMIGHGWFENLEELILVVRDEDIFWQNMRLGLHPKDSFPLCTDPLKAAKGLLCPNLVVKVMTWRILFDHEWRVGKPSAESPYCIIWPESHVARPPPTTVAILDQEY